MEIKPSKKIVICTEVKDSKTGAGILLSIDDEQSKPEMGIVYAIGEGTLPIEINVGDTIIYRKYTENKVFVQTEAFNFIDFKDIVGVVSNGSI